VVSLLAAPLPLASAQSAATTTPPAGEVSAATAGQQAQAQDNARDQATQAAAPIITSKSVFKRTYRQLKDLGLFGGSPDGFYPNVTTVYPGGWLAFGGGYRRPFGDAGAVDLNGAWSVKNFKKVNASVALTPILDGRVALEIDGVWIDAPSVAFYGIGNDSREEDRTTFSYRPMTVGVTASTTPWKAVRFGGGIDYVTIDTVAALDGGAEVVESLGRPSGLAGGPRYLRSRVFAEVERRAPDYSGRGGTYRLELEDYADRSGSDLGFRSLEAEVIQLVPILRASWVLALRGLATVTDDRDGADVPFYLMPSIGGNSSVRGYSSFRFRGNHRLLMSAEYRWTAVRFLDMAVFYDTGKVAGEIEQLRLTDLKWAYGVGARFHNSTGTLFRLEVARNDERAWRFILSTGAAF
jgi:hypothetical protein